MRRYKLKKRILSLLLSVIMLSALTVPTGADTQEWNGVSELQNGITYTVSERILVSGNTIIPTNTRIRVQGNGELVFPRGSNVNLFGEIRVSPGGELFISGSFTTRPSSTLNINGLMLCSLSSVVTIAGSVNIRHDGEIRTSGTFNTTTKSSITNTDSSLRFLKSSVATLSGTYTDTREALMRVAGEVGISSSGKINNFGVITIVDRARLVNSGTIFREKHSTFNIIGTFRNTPGGRVVDNMTDPPEPPDPPRPLPPWRLLTPQYIGREPVTNIVGIDVSRWNGDIDWESVARTNIEFVMMRIGVGAFRDSNGVQHPDSMDRRFREYIAGAQAAGLEVGVYWYSYAQTVEAIVREARYLISILGEFNLTYPVALDMEEPREFYRDCPSEMADAFLEIVAQAGYFPMLYSFRNFLESYITEEVREKYTVWVAHTRVSATNYKGTYYMWQYSHTGRVSGLTGDVDLNIAYRDFAAYIRRHGLNRLPANF
jgi:GH25 family lysozyme M1 (1,4-beta-N-acetylmuramidase)